MTELYIDGVSVVLPDNFSTTIKRENPFFTHSGEYSYDITLSLKDKTNAALFAHLNRLNSISELKSKRKAVLIANNRVYCNGTEVVTGWTETTVSIQVVSGNSELNYFIGVDELMITDLDSDKTSSVSDTNDSSLLTGMMNMVYPNNDYCLATVFNRGAGYYINQWREVNVNNSSNYEIRLSSRRYAQPYLCAYIKFILESLGYDLELNQLESTDYAQLIITHVVETNVWREMLPGVKVQQFLEDVENLFNMVFVLDNRTKKARLLFRNSYYYAMKTAHVLHVKDIYQAEIEEPEFTDPSAGNVSYLLLDNDYWKYHCMESSIIDKAVKMDIPSSYLPTYNDYVRLLNWFKVVNNQRKDVLWYDVVTSRYILYREMDGNIPYFRVLNDFPQLTRDTATVDIEINMIPVEYEAQRYANELNGSFAKALAAL